MSNLTLRNLFIKHKGKTIFDVTFSEEHSSREEPLTTIVIGENGAGKSYLLTVVSELFRGINNLKRNKEAKFKYDEYHITYEINNIIFNIYILKNQVNTLKNNIKVNLKDIILPSSLLAVSFMVNDKFTFSTQNHENDEIYSYIGVRRTSNATWTTSIAKKITNSLISNLHNKEFSEKVLQILKFLKFQPRVLLNFSPVNKTFFTRKTSLTYINSKVNSLKRKNYFRSDAVSKYDQETISKLVKYVNNIIENNKINQATTSNLTIKINLEDTSEWTSLSNNLKYLNMLVELQLIKSPELLLLKFEEFEFEHASSGEKHLLFTLINLAAEIQQSSIIFIDEPELSLHPNWQMKYISILKKLFSDYKSCHFLIATHSHYLISDLKKESSSILYISVENSEEYLVRNAKLLDIDTYAWSAENILYNIFGVRTSRNYYFESDLRKLINLIENKSEDTVSIKNLLLKIEEMNIDEADPLTVLITETKEYIKNVT